jgi:hypothetical protein
MKIQNLLKDYYSQNGEDGVVKYILDKLDKNNWCCEFGAWDGKNLSNTFNLVEKSDFNAVYIEPDEVKYESLLETVRQFSRIIPINKEVGIEKNTLDEILSETDIPKNFDILSIDVDGIDYAIWKSFKNYEPKVVIIEVNSGIGPDVLLSEHELTEHSLSTRTGVNFRTCYELGRDKGYTLIYYTGNMIFIHNDYKHLFDCYDDNNYLEAYRTWWNN